MREYIKTILIAIAIVIPVRMFIAQPFIVEGASMEQNFHGGDYLIIDELSYQFRNPARGDVIVFRYPLNPRNFFIKRIIGLPGEEVQILDGSIFITGIPGALQEPYLPRDLSTWPNLKLRLGQDQYFVLGDNRGHSSDSRTWGVLPKDNITGRALVRLWPITNIGFIANAPQ
ncbi:signal peptidase I [Candidatus Giovannonibacteria bacterium RIFCSPHIGHO2_02_FULL_46_20]|uniref:Signal peptidase I n=1 Tax=Candidatus Giovannonibacteria bacterium RIFCSPHIGHO2_02_FULL_46_20 TaxID=1798338 RepID=A0A1F5WGD3_9BACT|nr:MAG: signal peptidase I [Candidatus Giovannonibacteria bacterium RIFCSPHIGHO2_02_FULL_46_20]